VPELNAMPEVHMLAPDVPFRGSLALTMHRVPELVPRPQLAMPGLRVLLATDGSAEADGAVSVALAVARDRIATVEVLSVLPPTAYASSRRAVVDDERRAQRRHDVDQQLVRASPITRHWDVDLQLGTPCSIIAAEASARFVDLVVMGLSRHSLLDRVFRDETTLRVMRRIRMPLLAVAPSLRDLPRRIVVALDFSRSSIEAARAAAGLVAPGGEIHLVHVQPRASTDGDDVASARECGVGVSAAFDRLLRGLAVPPNVRVYPVRREGPPYAQLECVLRQVGADLLALGTTRHDLIERVTVGRMTSAFTREASISLLAAPTRHTSVDT